MIAAIELLRTNSIWSAEVKSSVQELRITYNNRNYIYVFSVMAPNPENTSFLSSDIFSGETNILSDKIVEKIFNRLNYFINYKRVRLDFEMSIGKHNWLVGQSDKIIEIKIED